MTWYNTRMAKNRYNIIYEDDAIIVVDKPSGTEPPEGVWRDLRRPAMPGDIGMIDVMVRNPGALNISFSVKPGATTAIVLKTGADGVWSGQLTEGGRIVINAVLAATETTAVQCLQRLQLKVASSTLAVTRREYPGGESRVFNPITLITGDK